MIATATTMSDIKQICERYARLYTGAIADILDKKGLRNQVLPGSITAVTKADRVAGLAFTGQGYPAQTIDHDDTQTRLDMLNAIRPNTISVWACGGSTECAHWGEIMSNAARQRGCTGAVVDGGVRDVDFINAISFPVFAAFKSPASSIGRWDIVRYQIPIRIANVVIHPNDFVFGDIDGVVIVPQALTLEVLELAEDIYARETGMREAIRAGLDIKDAYAKYGSL